MQAFVVKVLLFCLPLTVLFSVPAGVFFFSREYYSLEESIRAQICATSTLYGKAFIDSDASGRLYKLALLREKQPFIITIGSSRMLGFREESFTQNKLFLNSAFGGVDMEVLERFVRELPYDTSVGLIILGLDQQFFKPGFTTSLPPTAPLPPLVRVADFFSYQWRVVYFDLVRGKISIIPLVKQNVGIGLAAVVDGDGYRSDGSYRYGKLFSDGSYFAKLTDDVNSTLQKIESDRGSLQYGTSTSQSSLILLENLLKEARDRKITVLGMMTPLNGQVYDTFTSKDDDYQRQVTELPQKVRYLFKKYERTFYDFSDATLLGGSSDEYISYDHPTDKLDLRMLIYMAERSKELREYVDLDKARALLRSTEKPFLDP